jgi:hypothetical protein
MVAPNRRKSHTSRTQQAVTLVYSERPATGRLPVGRAPCPSRQPSPCPRGGNGKNSVFVAIDIAHADSNKGTLLCLSFGGELKHPNGRSSRNCHSLDSRDTAASALGRSWEDWVSPPVAHADQFRASAFPLTSTNLIIKLSPQRRRAAQAFIGRSSSRRARSTNSAARSSEGKRCLQCRSPRRGAGAG